MNIYLPAKEQNLMPTWELTEEDIEKIGFSEFRKLIKLLINIEKHIQEMKDVKVLLKRKNHE